MPVKTIGLKTSEGLVNNMEQRDIANIRKAKLILKGWEDETVSYSNKQVQAYIKAVDDWSDKSPEWAVKSISTAPSTSSL